MILSNPVSSVFIVLLGSLLKYAFEIPFSATVQKHLVQIDFNYILIHAYKHAHTHWHHV